jgi:hypothetical protein
MKRRAGIREAGEISSRVRFKIGALGGPIFRFGVDGGVKEAAQEIDFPFLRNQQDTKHEYRVGRFESSHSSRIQSRKV